MTPSQTVTDSLKQPNILSSCIALSELESEVLELLHERCTERRYAAGESLIRQGDPGDSLLILLSGRASATVSDESGNRHLVGEFGVFDVIGEMAILTGEPRTADVIADQDGHALVLQSDDFHELVSRHPELGVVLTHMVAERLGGGSADGLGSKVVDRYRIQRCIGRGGMAIVYEARELDTDETVALKMMSHRLMYEKGAKARFQREADILSTLQNANITRVWRRFSAYRTSFIAMEFCDGSDLSQLIQNGLDSGEKNVRKLLGQLAAGLEYLHSQGVVHRDLKPQNVLVSRDGSVKLTDFGLARTSSEPARDGLTVPGAVLGTPMYMAPEQFDGAESSPAGDIYSLGCIALEVLTGIPPFHGQTFFEIAAKKLSDPLPPRRELGHGISRKLHALLKMCLAPKPEDRKIDLRSFIRWSAPITISPSRFPVLPNREALPDRPER